MSKPVILVTGKNGQLGNELRVLSASYQGYDFLFTDLPELDITDYNQLKDCFQQHKPAYCLNAGAYTAVDRAEADKDIAMKVNAEAVGSLAALCKEYGAHLVHVSTDYVFDGTADTPYTEESATDPVNYYGLTKQKGEELALQHLADTVIIRTSWVYSYYGNNFVKTMLRLMSERESINVVSDQVGSPTYAADLASVIMQIVQQIHDGHTSYPGIYHFSNEGIISWFEFAVAIKELAGSKCLVNPIPTSAYPTPAKRPAYSGLNKKKITAVFNIEVPAWEPSLQKCFSLLQAPAAQ